MRLLVPLLGLALAGAPGLSAQSPRAGRVHDILAAADPQAVFRLRSLSGLQVEGPVLRLDSMFVTLGAGQPVALAEIEGVWQRGRAWRTGGIVGLVLGGIGGGLFGLGGAALNDVSGFGEAAPYVLLGTVGGAAVGFGLGAGIGSLFPAWRSRYP